MSNKDETRTRILEATRRLLEEADAPATMGRIATAAGVSRQLLYFHFDSQLDLLLSLSRAIDAEVRTEERQARVDNAGDAVTALREAVALQGYIKPRIEGIAAAVDRMRHSDPAAAAAWEERERYRYRRCRDLARRLDAEGALSANWDVAVAARLIWSSTAQRAWRELVIESGWSTKRWITHTTALLERALVN